MTKQEFLDELKDRLLEEGADSLVAENLNFYGNYIDGEVRKGRTEEEVLEELGRSALIAHSILEAAGYEVDGIPDRPAGNGTGNQGQGGSYGGGSGSGSGSYGGGSGSGGTYGSGDGSYRGGPNAGSGSYGGGYGSSDGGFRGGDSEDGRGWTFSTFSDSGYSGCLVPGLIFLAILVLVVIIFFSLFTLLAPVLLPLLIVVFIVRMLFRM